MQNKAEERLGISSREYQKLVQKKQPRPPLARNVVLAFLGGGTVCLLGQLVKDIFVTLGFSQEEATNPMVVIFIFIGVLLTGFGVFDRIVRYIGAGITVPITGFANSISSAAIEFKKEGTIAGTGARMFMMAGSVIMYGVVTAFLAAVISAIL
ncbi:MAG: stage V sporulation protein AC [Firmicutes bacterium]|nr:stage V sporulation protein AC [Bacillota bacterium]